jgi:inositol oxygenase
MQPAPGFRDFAAGRRPSVQELYRENHARQTLDSVLAAKQRYLPPRRREMSVWEALDALAAFVDASDPDLELPQLDHALQVAEALRAHGRPDWLVATGFLHDLGKVLHLFGEPQWAVVGDTFPVGCAFAREIVFCERFAANPDTRVPEYASPCGIYREGCGLDAVHFSWGHDEYLYQVLAPYLPEQALYAIRYHSFYAGHREGAYAHLLDGRDRALLPLVRDFSAYDLYSKAPVRLPWPELRPRYEDLLSRFLPDRIRW